MELDNKFTHIKFNNNFVPTNSPMKEGDFERSILLPCHFIYLEIILSMFDLVICRFTSKSLI